MQFYIVRCHDGSYTVVSMHNMIPDARLRSTRLHTIEAALNYARLFAERNLILQDPTEEEMSGDYRRAK